MPKRVPTISVTVVREDEGTGKRKRVTPQVGKPFNFTDDEIASVSQQHPGAFRKVINESAAEEPVDPETTPGKEGDKTANKTPKPKGKAAKKQAAARADSTSDEATEDADGVETSTDAADGEDDDI